MQAQPDVMAGVGPKTATATRRRPARLDLAQAFPLATQVAILRCKMVSAGPQ